MNHIQNAMNQAAELIRKAYDTAVAEGLLPEAEVRPVQIEIPKDLRNGDYASGFAMQNAKVLRQNPRKVAEILVEKMDLTGTCFASAEIAGPGFLNLRLSHSWFENVLNNITAEGENYGRTTAEKPEKVMVEFVSANPTGPMHMGNARGGVLGDCLAEVLHRAGNEVTREFYVNDAGNQIDKFASSLDARYRQIILGEDAVEFPENGYHGNDIKVLAQKFFEKNGDSYLNRPEKERHEALAQFGLENNIYLQIGLLMLIGLLAKTAILLTEYASQKRSEGMSITMAAMSAAKARLRPILMTSLTMIFGMLPLMFASGVGANGNISIGVGTVGGMLIGTIALLIIVPALFIVFQYVEEKVMPKRIKE